MKALIVTVLAVAVIVGAFFLLSKNDDVQDTQKEISNGTTEPLHQAKEAREQTDGNSDQMREKINEQTESFNN